MNLVEFVKIKNFMHWQRLNFSFIFGWKPRFELLCRRDSDYLLGEHLLFFKFLNP